MLEFIVRSVEKSEKFFSDLYQGLVGALVMIAALAMPFIGIAIFIFVFGLIF